MASFVPILLFLLVKTGILLHRKSTLIGFEFGKGFTIDLLAHCFADYGSQPNSKQMKITFFGSGSGTQIDSMYRLMQATASALPLDATIITGGFTGSGMEAPALGAGDRHSIGYTMLGLPGNKYLKETADVAQYLPTGAGNELMFTARLAKLMESDAFVLGGDGGIGTLVEFATWCNLNAKIWKKAKTPKRLAIMWPGNPEESPFYPILAVVLPTLAVEVQNLIRWCKTAEEAVAWVAS